MADNNNLERIMEEITLGLTGDSDKDIRYLREQMEKFKDHKFAREIVRACGRLLYKTLPEEKKAELSKLIDNNEKGFDETIDEIKFNIYKKNYDVALELIENMIKEYEAMHLYEDDEVSEYHCFYEAMEDVLYHILFDPQKDVRHCSIDFAQMYTIYGGLLIDLKRFDDAEAALKKAVLWNPCNAHISFELSETYKLRGMLEEFEKQTRDTLNIVFRRESFARCFRNMAYYFVEKKEYKAAVCCLLYSNGFAPSEKVQAELYYITKLTGEQYDPKPEELAEYFSRYDLPLGPNKEMLKAAYSYGMHLYEKGEKQGAAYFLEIVAEFVKDEEIDGVLGKIKA